MKSSLNSMRRALNLIVTQHFIQMHHSVFNPFFLFRAILLALIRAFAESMLLFFIFARCFFCIRSQNEFIANKRNP